MVSWGKSEAGAGAAGVGLRGERRLLAQGGPSPCCCLPTGEGLGRLPPAGALVLGRLPQPLRWSQLLSDCRVASVVPLARALVPPARFEPLRLR